MIGDVLEFASFRLVPEKVTLARETAALSELCEEVIEEMRLVHPLRAIVLDARDDGRGLGIVTGCSASSRTSWERARLQSAAHGGPGHAPPARRTLPRRHPQRGAAHRPGDAPYHFEPFERGSGVPGRPGGLGLGLFIAQQIVRAHDGEISVGSVEDGGTTFTVDLPIVRAR